MRFEKKVVVVTGGGSGIGLEVARRFHQEGASVVLSGRDESKLNAAASSIGSDDRVLVVPGDIAKLSTGALLIESAERRFGGVDILVNNAGIFKPTPFAEVTEEQYDSFLDIILKGKFFTAQAAAKSMKK